MSHSAMSPASKTPRQPPTAAQSLLGIWLEFLGWSVDLFAAAEGVSPKSYLCACTGLSPAHISTKSLLGTSKRRLAQAIQHANEVELQGLVALAGFTHDEALAYIQSLPTTPLARVVQRITHGHPTQMRLATAFAGQLDSLVTAVIEALEVDDLDAYRRHLIAFLQSQLPHVQPGELALGQLHPKLLIQRLEANPSEEQLRNASEKAFEYLLFALLAAIDVEWASEYVPRLKPSPTFHWLMPSCKPDFNPAAGERIRKGWLGHPIGHLLDLMWAISMYAGTNGRKWPESRPGAAKLAKDIGIVDLTDHKVRKWQRGLRPVALVDALAVWKGLLQDKRLEADSSPPIPWITLALWFQRALIGKKVNLPDGRKEQRFIFFPELVYQAIWLSFRHRWKDELPRPGKEAWPEHLLPQPSCPDWLRSSHSSGLSSSPRDCQ